MSAQIDWKPILQQLVAAVLPLLIAAIVKWLEEATEEEVVSVASKVGKWIKESNKVTA